MRILLLTRYSRLGPSSRLRSYQYAPFLENQGFKVTIAPLLDDSYLQRLYSGLTKDPVTVIRAYWRRIIDLIKGFRYDLIWIEKEIFPWLPAWGENLLHYLGVPYLVDYDDAIFHYYDLHPNPGVRLFFRHKIDRIMKQATVVTVGNDYLAERARQAGAPRIEVLPTVVDLSHYPVPKPPRNSIFTLGWIGSPVTEKYLTLIGPALAEFGKTAKMRLILIGARNVKLPGVPLECYSWSEALEADQISRFDVGLMPLIDEPFERGKCGYKLIQYMASGRPVIASPVGVNRKIVTNGINGYLAATETEWLAALQLLYDNSALRAQLGKAGRSLVEQKYSLQVSAPKLVSILRTISGS